MRRSVTVARRPETNGHIRSASGIGMRHKSKTEALCPFVPFLTSFTGLTRLPDGMEHEDMGSAVKALFMFSAPPGEPRAKNGRHQGACSMSLKPYLIAAAAMLTAALTLPFQPASAGGSGTS